jgi:hypothetical protein
MEKRVRLSFFRSHLKMSIHRNPRWERSPKKLNLDIVAIQRHSVDPLLVLDELNNAMIELMMASMKKEQRTKSDLRKIVNAGRRDL